MWKDVSYWLKGGIIFLAIDILLISLLSIIGGNPYEGDNSIFTSVHQPILSWFTNLNESNPTLQTILVASQGLIGYFVIGAVIGWIYGIVKNKIIS